MNFVNILVLWETVIIAKDYLGNAYLPEYNFFNGIGDMICGQGYQIKTSTETVLENKW